MTDDVRERVDRYVANHPNADRWEVLPALGLGPDHQNLVDEILEDHEDDPDDGPTPSRFEVPVDEQCCKPRCHEPRVNPHPHSLCKKHHPGDPTRNEQTSIDDIDDQAEQHDRLLEARAVAGDEPVDEDDTDPVTEAALEAAIAREREQQDSSKQSGGTDAALFMGGDSPHATADSTPEPQGRPSETRLARPMSGLPLAQLDALAPADRRRLAKQRGVDWPTTERARDQLFDTITEVMRNEDDRVVDAPTSLGKSYTVASTRWGAREDLTGDRPVVHLSATRDARDEAIEAAEADGGKYFVLKSRHEACPVAAGDYDPQEDDVDYTPITIEGEPASEYIQRQCDGKGLAFSAVHRHLEDHNDQGIDLPCCEGDVTCPAIHQWEEFREGDWPLVIATHNFAHVPGLRTNTNLVIDEQVDFTQELSTDRVRRAVGAYLRAIDAPVSTWEEFMTIAKAASGEGSVSVTDYQDLRDALNDEPDRDWYFEHEDAHALAPALARALLHAEERANGRRVGKTDYKPPRLDAKAHDSEEWNKEWLTIVLDETNEVRTVRCTPDLQTARSVIGLDAHPALPVWQANTLPYIQRAEVLEPEQRQLWRRYERGLRVVQVGDATRPLASGEYFDYEGCRALVEHLHDEYGDRFRTALTAASVEDQLESIMANAGVGDPELMHFGEEKSRNDFANEQIGLVNGCIDPGDDYVVDLIAELDLDAEPERSDTPCPECNGDGCHACDGIGSKRAHGRGFVGDDAATAQEILAAVRENHTAQAAGRYARNPDDPGSTATVFVRTDAMPPGFADIQTPGVVWRFSNKQEQIIRALREQRGRVTARELANDLDVSKRHVHRTLKRLVEDGVVDAAERAGPNGATLYADTGTPNAGVVDLTDEDGDIVTDPVWGSYTWAVSIRAPSLANSTDQSQPAPQTDTTSGVWAWETADRGGGNGG